jgi:hypothetical protein
VPARHAASKEALRQGDLVRILTDGRKGFVCGEADKCSGRCRVQILGSFSVEILTLHAENLRVVSSSEVADIELSGRNEFGCFSSSPVFDNVWQELLTSGALARLAEFAFDAEIAGIFGQNVRFGTGSVDEEKSFLFSNLQEIVSCEKVAGIVICDVKFVAEGLKRIYDGARSLADVLLLPRQSMCPLDVPLLERVLISVKMIEFVLEHRKGWTSKGPDIFQMVFDFQSFWQRCAMLCFPSLARFHGPSISAGTIAQERRVACDLLVSQAAKELMQSLWHAAGTNMLVASNSISNFVESICAFDPCDIEDTVVCLCCVELAHCIAQRGPSMCVFSLSQFQNLHIKFHTFARCLMDMPFADDVLTKACLVSARILVAHLVPAI